MRITVVDDLAKVGAAAWRGLEAADFPFSDYAFLAAMAEGKSLGEGTGWQPAYLLAGDDPSAPDAAAIAYVKGHSYGEYVFDWAWARFYQQNGRAYYPKLVSAIPFTPATGPKLLVRPGADGERCRQALTEALTSVAKQHKFSSAHALFLVPAEIEAYAARGYAIRHSCQFHWRNDGYRDFADFLDRFIGKRRRDVQRERRRAAGHGLEIRCRTGAELTPAHAAAMHDLYLATAGKKRAIPYVQAAVFERLFATMADRILLVTAEDGPRVVAAALNFYKGTTLYGRYWGASEEYQDLHFELCYYQTIDFAIQRGLSLFEAGAQGEHKIQRGFLPALTPSAHYLFDAQMRPPVEAFIKEEQAALAEEIAALASKSPFAQPPSGDRMAAAVEPSSRSQ